jgi:hypothetical protein
LYRFFVIRKEDGSGRRLRLMLVSKNGFPVSFS